MGLSEVEVVRVVVVMVDVEPRMVLVVAYVVVGMDDAVDVVVEVVEAVVVVVGSGPSLPPPFSRYLPDLSGLPSPERDAFMSSWRRGRRCRAADMCTSSAPALAIPNC